MRWRFFSHIAFAMAGSLKFCVAIYLLRILITRATIFAMKWRVILLLITPNFNNYWFERHTLIYPHYLKLSRRCKDYDNYSKFPFLSWHNVVFYRVFDEFRRVSQT